MLKLLTVIAWWVYKQKNPRSLSEEKTTRKHPCGRWGIRTPDPLLVRQTLWTNWAKLPNRCPVVHRSGDAKVLLFLITANFFELFLSYFFILVSRHTALSRSKAHPPHWISLKTIFLGAETLYSSPESPEHAEKLLIQQPGGMSRPAGKHCSQDWPG